MAFIAIEGNDGSGKATQTALLAAELEHAGFRVHQYAFPAYQTTIGGKLLAKLLADEGSNFVTADPRLASLPYSLDRHALSPAIRKALTDGEMVVADRFIGSNQIHQGGKLKSIGERVGYLNWLEDLEHGQLQVPRPDLVLYLKVSVEVSLQWLAGKRASKGGVLGDGELDQVEKNRPYLENSHEMANWLAGYYPHWRVIDCVDKAGHIRTREDIHADVMHHVDEIWK